MRTALERDKDNKKKTLKKQRITLATLMKFPD